MRHLISMLLQNEAGALARVAGLFASRGYNIESLLVAPTRDADVSRLTLVVDVDEAAVEQIVKQSAKLVDVIEIADLGGSDATAQASLAAFQAALRHADDIVERVRGDAAYQTL
ncbi:acetolactate synthase small subunit [Luteibacter jiangsuensis]|uniref:Acetolactate synthase small subunit n=1 Tax=Luteibacter jiangsuensis TaxID=637577 RepID=A0ABX0Q9H4_9GAMM|nr:MULTISPECIES: acetolactate synthase small subunit [Luteibacter]NID06272.1 acetolactate synthase small subunit [Luteibacter jiangsuensis]NII55890.1 acetolactate synthase small subunit [Luteibacter sp. SG786]